jgi:hypothetical protein
MEYGYSREAITVPYFKQTAVAVLEFINDELQKRL